MIKTIEIVSLSSGVIGEPFASHELQIGVDRLEAMGLHVKFSKNALKGIKYLKDHPEDRAADLIEAYADPDVDRYYAQSEEMIHIASYRIYLNMMN